MKESKINFNVTLDDNNVPEKIIWEATDQSEDGPADTKAISLSIWDQKLMNTLRIDLWTKDMPLFEMKRFYIDMIGGLGQSLLRATGDAEMATEIEMSCERLVEILKKQPQK